MWMVFCGGIELKGGKRTFPSAFKCPPLVLDPCDYVVHAVPIVGRMC